MKGGQVSRCVGASALLLVACAGGCHQYPSVGISDPTVYTTAHIRLAQRQYEASVADDPVLAQGRAHQLSLFADMQRYFASKNSDYEAGKLRMDAMLDGRQQAESFGRVLAQAVSAKAAVGSGLSLPTNSASPAAGTDPTKFSDADAKALQDVLSASVVDSPFDQLQRARSFFTEYAVALLRLFGTDSRVINVDASDPIEAMQLVPTRTNLEKVELARKGIKAAQDLQDSLNKSLDGFAKTDFGKRDDVKDLILKITNAKADGKKAKEDIEGTPGKPGQKADLDTKNLNLKKAQQNLDAQKAELAALQADLDRATKVKERESVRTKIAQRQALVEQADFGLKSAQGDVASASKALQKLQQQQTDAQADEVRARRGIANLIFEEPTRLSLAALEELKASAKENPQDQPQVDGDYRLVLLLLQAHVEPGNAPDQVAAIRLTAKDKDIKVLYVSPTRTYDLDDQRRVDSEQTALSLSVAALIPGKGSGQIDADRRERDEERGRYLSRISKTNSFVEASNGATQFGWYFYPSNVVVEKHWGGYKAVGYLEGGGRDCTAWLLVPTSQTSSIKLTIETRRGCMESEYRDFEGSREIEVKLPPVSFLESATGAIGTAPSQSATGPFSDVRPTILWHQPNQAK